MIKYFLPFFFFRLYSLTVTSVYPNSLGSWIAFSRGFFSDALLAFCLWLVLDKVFKKRQLRVVTVALVILLCGVNFEHIIANDANLNFDFMEFGTSGTFFLGSVLSVKNIPVLTFCLANLWLFWFLAKHFEERCLDVKATLLIVLVLILGSFCVPLKVGFSYWAQMNFLEENSRRLPGKLPAGNVERLDDLDSWHVQDGVLVRRVGSSELMNTFFRKDLSGAKVINTSTSLSNLLIVFVEGLSYDSIGTGHLPFLAELKDRGLFFSNYITLQRQTNRGMYAALCGDYPNYVDKSAKMDHSLLLDFNKECLPGLLKNKGYYSVFMQSNDLNFMHKGLFARKIGFDEVYGDRTFKRAIARSNWGVDDRTLYRRALEKIDSLTREKAPWMLTLLTVSTHHPYLVPGVPVPTVGQALKFVDDTLREFVEGLEARGQLKNTLVVITSDESAFRSGEDELARALSQNHAPFIVFGGPVSEALVQNDYFTQADLLLSFADFLNVDMKDGFGRSIFRRYDKKRNLIFGNVYASKLYSFNGDGEFYACTQDLDCESFSTEGDFFLETPSNRIRENARFVGLIKETLLYNDTTNEKIAAGKAVMAAALR